MGLWVHLDYTSDFICAQKNWYCQTILCRGGCLATRSSKTACGKKLQVNETAQISPDTQECWEYLKISRACVFLGNTWEVMKQRICWVKLCNAYGRNQKGKCRAFASRPRPAEKIQVLLRLLSGCTVFNCRFKKSIFSYSNLFIVPQQVAKRRIKQTATAWISNDDRRHRRNDRYSIGHRHRNFGGVSD
jgi:hypothetical protein